MKGTKELTRPLARKDNLIVRALPDETLVYDLDNNKAHCLNHTAAIVWQHCDGRTSVSELARLLARDAADPVDEQVVWYALKQLRRDHLLAAEVSLPTHLGGLTRRQMIRTLGLSAAIALPLVTTIVAPSSVQAFSGLGPGACCTTSAQCASGLCGAATGACPDGACA